jgi:hypothetical protein
MKLFKKWLSMSDDEKMAACGSDARILSVVASEISGLGCPSSTAALKDEFTRLRKPQQLLGLEDHHEYLKLCLRVFEGVNPDANWGS